MRSNLKICSQVARSLLGKDRRICAADFLGATPTAEARRVCLFDFSSFLRLLLSRAMLRDLGGEAWLDHRLGFLKRLLHLSLSFLGKCDTAIVVLRGRMRGARSWHWLREKIYILGRFFELV